MKKGWRADVRNKNGETSLGVAMAENHVECVELLKKNSGVQISEK